MVEVTSDQLHIDLQEELVKPQINQLDLNCFVNLCIVDPINLNDINVQYTFIKKIIFLVACNYILLANMFNSYSIYFIFVDIFNFS